MSLSLSCVSWNDLPNIDDTPHLDSEDERCLNEIRAVLLRHGKASRLGVAVLHQHFQLESDEVLVEHCDPSLRTLTSKPIKIEDMLAKNNYRPTIIRFDGGRAQGCRWCVPDNALGKHSEVGC
jgi:hypothetical protein